MGDRERELRAFDESKSGVKVVVDAGVTKIPKIFINEQHKQENNRGRAESEVSVAVIDLKGIEEEEDNGGDARVL